VYGERRGSARRQPKLWPVAGWCAGRNALTGEALGREREVVMNIEIDPHQCEVLADLVEHRLANISTEIRHTDSARLRQDLRHEREVLRRLRAVLSPVAA
jgi:16S rRNA G966 N2-methylase RsmD